MLRLKMEQPEVVWMFEEVFLSLPCCLSVEIIKQERVPPKPTIPLRQDPPTHERNSPAIQPIIGWEKLHFCPTGLLKPELRRWATDGSCMVWRIYLSILFSQQNKGVIPKGYVLVWRIYLFIDLAAKKYGV